MRKTYLAGLLPPVIIAYALLFLTSCDDEKKGIELDVPYTVTSIISVDTTNRTGFHDLDEVVIQSRLDSLLTANNAKRSDIADVVISSVKFQLVDSTGQTLTSDNFDAVESVQMFIKSPTFLNDSLIAYKNAIPDGSTLVELDLNQNIQFKRYIEDTEFTLKAAANTSAPITEKKYIKMIIVFTITAAL